MVLTKPGIATSTGARQPQKVLSSMAVTEPGIATSLLYYKLQQKQKKFPPIQRL
jgi:hypothetical protein